VTHRGPQRLIAALLPAALSICIPTGAAAQPQSQSQSPEQAHGGGTCPSPAQVRPLELPSSPAATPPLPAPDGSDYRHLLRPTPAGWPIVEHWCVWIEPTTAVDGTGEARRQADWLAAVEAALQQWSELLSISRVTNPEQAQVRLWRRRPPLQRLADGRQRASHGRAVLTLVAAWRQQQWWAEPRIDVLLSAGQAPLPLQATALHELGHAFGLWAHSDQAGDAMAAIPGGRPVLQLSRRDRATMQWLLGQRPQMPTATKPAEIPAAAPTPPKAPTAD
jgi:hypothetical protein